MGPAATYYVSRGLTVFCGGPGDGLANRGCDRGVATGQLRVVTVAITAGALLLVAGAVRGETVTLQASQDNTLYESPSGSLSNGAGEHLFSGRTGQPANSRRRALVAFDVVSAVPVGSKIHAVSLDLTATLTGPQPSVIHLHRLTSAWGEGSSDAGDPGGLGAAVTAGDATWIHAFYDTAPWAATGGDFTGLPSASAEVAIQGPVQWSSPALISDVQAWVNDPAGQAGWILLGDEESGGSAVRFASREHADANARPVLTVEFTPPVPAVPALSGWGSLAMALILAATARRVFSRSPEARA